MSTKAAETLREIMARRGWSQGELARQLGVSPDYVSRWLSGERRPGLEMALKVQDSLGIPPADWLDTEQGAA